MLNNFYNDLYNHTDPIFEYYRIMKRKTRVLKKEKAPWKEILRKSLVESLKTMVLRTSTLTIVLYATLIMIISGTITYHKYS